MTTTGSELENIHVTNEYDTEGTNSLWGKI